MAWFVVLALGGWLQAASLAWPLPIHVIGLAPGAPSGMLQILSLALLAFSLQRVPSVGLAFWRGWVFAFAWLAGTFWWLYVSMHDYGGLAGWMAVLSVAALAGALAAIYGAATAAQCAVASPWRWLQALTFAALWALAELARGRWFTGFPWGAGGYAQIDFLGAWAPWVGVYGLGALSAALAAGLALSARAAADAWPRRSTADTPRGQLSKPVVAAGSLAAFVGAAASLLLMGGRPAPNDHHTDPAGTMNVWLLQGNIPQNQKFEPGTGVAVALTWYPAQVAQAAQARQQGHGPDLVVAPETAIPLLPQQLGPAFWGRLFEPLAASAAGGGKGLGVLLGLPLGNFSEGYTNAAWGLDASALADHQQVFPGERFYRYDKHHLVPFGEFIPPFFRWFTDLMRIPLGDFDRGPLAQAPWAWAGQRVAANICYEDLFGEELAAAFQYAEQAPTVLVNLSNIGWFGNTVAIDQHLHISRMRALELGRPMLRATNTGATAAIDHNGRVLHLLPRHTRDRLEARVQGRTGLTPYARWASRWGQWPVWGLCMGVLAVGVVARRRLSGAAP
jgi:apolipoprotein N-acyltransferase